MNQSPLRRRKLLIFVFLIFINTQLYSEENGKKENVLSQKINERTYQNWINYYIPFFTPTESQLRQKLEKDPDWKMYFNPESEGLQTGEMVLKETTPQKIPVQNIKEVKKDQKPEGAVFAVAIPKRGGSQTVVSPKNLTSSELQNQTRNIKAPILTKNDLSGIWVGEYNKLIEYYDPETKKWNESKSSLKGLNVKLEIMEDGNLKYVLPDREGAATYSSTDNKLTIDCEDVRVCGEYEMMSKENKIDLKTTRILIKEKMRTTIEMTLAKQP